MKRILTCFFLCFLMMFTSACHHSGFQTPSSCPQVFSAADLGVSDAKSVEITSHITGTDILLNDSAILEKIISAVKPLNGSNPISARGYYGGSYGLSFFDTAEPTESDQPYLTFSLFAANETDFYIIYGMFEEVEGHCYGAMYSANADDVSALETMLAQYID